MARVANASRSHAGTVLTTSNPARWVSVGATGYFFLLILTRIPLNDDRHEKAMRLQSRQALHDIQMNKIKAAASPMRKQHRHDMDSSSNPLTPPSATDRPTGSLDSLLTATANSMTPIKRMPILANFEEWMKMATDNKINATNSWNFALIDYFHDMSLLKDGDGVNFQKASCTLDGCVKIYTSRVDSVATETGKLLSGLAEGDGKNARASKGEPPADDDQDDGLDENTSRKARRKVGGRCALQLAQANFNPSSDRQMQRLPPRSHHYI